MKLHILRCGSMRVSPAVPFGGGISLQNSARELLSPDRMRVELPVFCFLLEHPRGPILVDAGWCRELSPAGVYDPAAVRRVLPAHLAAFYRPELAGGDQPRLRLRRGDAAQEPPLAAGNGGGPGLRRGALQPRPGPLPRHPGVLRVAP